MMPSLKSKPTGQAAFTLIELLTVIAIVALLAALTTVLVSKIQQSARSTQCTSNLRQMGVAIFLYASDNQGKLPNNSDNGLWVSQIWSYAAAGTGHPETMPSDELPPEYLGTIFACPEAGDDDEPRIRDYAFNQRLGDGNSKTADPIASLAKPARHAMVADAKNGSWLSISIFDPRHNEMVNVLYADGHVALTELTDEITANYNSAFWGRQAVSHLW